MLDPTTFPTAMSGDPESTACIDTSSSGAEVPRPTMTKPTTSLDMPSRSAIEMLPRTRNSPPRKRSKKPPTRNPISIHTSKNVRLLWRQGRGVNAIDGPKDVMTIDPDYQETGEIAGGNRPIP